MAETVPNAPPTAPLPATPLSPPPTTPHIQLPPMGRTSASPVLRLGAKRRPLSDFYHLTLTLSWAWLLAIVVALYLLGNLLFALGYLWFGGVEGARPGSFTDAFFFSVQTLSTLGYGKLVPTGLAANILVSAEALCGLLGFSVGTGFIFARLSRPSARVLFSNVAVVTVREGVPSLMFRMANERANQIVDVKLRAVIARSERTAEGEVVRRFHELHFAREWAALFSLSWTAIHPITPQSPLHGMTTESLKAQSAEIIVLITGVDETFGQEIHARFSYLPDQLLWNARLVDVMLRLPNGRFAVDYTHFHDTVSDAPALPAKPA
jgi:inward rectifier potassium channel